MAYAVMLDPAAERQLGRIDKASRLRILKKLVSLEKENQARHLEKGLPFFVAEAGQFRICFKVQENGKEKRVYFIGNHKEYEKWYSGK
ncbi:MAG: hypothetical protein V1676_00190 [Candidatus Diapherotrites archaeon]